MSTAIGNCWRTIGVQGGDHSCPRLAQEIHCRNCDVFRQAARGLLRRALEPMPPLVPVLQTKAEAESRSVLCLRLGRDWLAFGCERIAEVADAKPPRRIAHRARGAVEGLVAVRGELHLCLALIELLQLGLRQDLVGEHTRLVLLAPEHSPPVAFRANEVIGLRRIAVADIEEVPSTMPKALTRCVVGVIPFEFGRLALLDDVALIGLLEEALFE